MAKKQTTQQPATPTFPVVTKTIRTRINKDAQPVATTLTIQFDDDELMREYATAHAVVIWQSIARAGSSIPTSDSVTLTELRKRSGETRRNRPVTADAVVGAMRQMPDDALRAAMAAAGFPKSTIDAIMAARKPKP